MESPIGMQNPKSARFWNGIDGSRTGKPNKNCSNSEREKKTLTPELGEAGTTEMETTRRCSWLLDDVRGETEWESTNATSEGAMKVGTTTLSCSWSDDDGFCLQRGRWGRRNMARAVGERLGLGLLGFLEEEK
ncbi:hypothetical protein PIB30_059057 [Stylosanthes scabra]|uniref:Uncharacterized protein n=1 Tax=Stylosanthes scabra TaxID=79078 RepID=A0ABU6QJU8_9FABA|nr:hypothetical protein [Stylosanthes scabra]